MKRGDQDRFAMPFADIWQHLPFSPSANVAVFLQDFMDAGRFDAERFWECVSARKSPASVGTRQSFPSRLGKTG
jgi:hypothetical protein